MFGKKKAADASAPDRELTSQEFDHLPKVDQPQEDPFEGESGVEVHYDLHPEEVKKGLLILQKEQLYKKNIIYSVILGIIFVLYLLSVIKDPNYTLGIFLMLISATVIGLIWYMPYRHRSSMAKGVAGVEGGFSMIVYPSGLRIPQTEGKVDLPFRMGVKVKDLEEMYLIDADRYRIYLLPKRCISQEDQNALSEIFAAAAK
jgi:hypothetical protein